MSHPRDSTVMTDSIVKITALNFSLVLDTKA